MAYFEVQVEPDGTDRAFMIDSDNWMIPGSGITTSLDVFVWNGTDTPVDVRLLAGHSSLMIAKDPSHYNDAQTEEQYRRVETSVISGIGPEVEIFGLGPGSFYPFVIGNPTSNTPQRWLDPDNCYISTAGHGTNIFNGQRVYVIGHHS